ncbi:MAG TPA: hypothetical protein VMY42_13955 [Thermoguttaceae bacterium]|nr:hypothetical protein [Thermoguttaceae bacterium]
MGQLTAKFPSLERVDYAFDATIAVDVGDLMFHDTDDAKPASSQADGGTEILNQRTFAKRFAGVSLERKLVGETTAGTIAVAPVWVGDYTVTSGTFEVGDLLAADEASGGTALEDQVLVKTTDPDLAIGFALERKAAAATTLLVCLVSRTTPTGTLPNVPVAKLVSQLLDHAAFTDNTGTATGYIDFDTVLPAGALVLGWQAVVSEAFAGDTTAVIQVGKSGTVAAFSADVAQSCFAIATVGSASLAASSYVAAAVAPRVTVTGGADWGSITAGKVVVTVLYLALI